MGISIRQNKENEKRVAVALRMGKPDAVPLDLSAYCNFLCGWLNVRPYDYYNRPDVMLECQVKFKERFKGYGSIAPDYSAAVEPSGFGARVIWPKDETPWIIPMIGDVDDIPDFVDALIEPDPLMSGYNPLVVSTYCYMKEMVGDLVSPPLGMVGPFEIACLLLGTQNMMLGMRLYPDDIHRLLKKTKQYVINCLEARAELFNDNLDVVSLGDDNPGLISPEEFKEFVIPYTGAIFKELGSSSSLNIWHCDGKLEHLIDLLPEMNINVLRTFDPYTDISLFKEKIGDKICLMGNIHPIRVLANQGKEEIESETRRIIEAGKAGGGFILSTGGELCHSIPEEHVDWFIEAAEKFG